MFHESGQVNWPVHADLSPRGDQERHNGCRIHNPLGSALAPVRALFLCKKYGIGKRISS
jgi:hypothetical protein